MSEDEHRPPPPSFRPGRPARRPDPSSALPVGSESSSAPEHPRRQVRRKPAADAARAGDRQPVARRSVRAADDDSRATPPPAFAPSARREAGSQPPAFAPGQGQPRTGDQDLPPRRTPAAAGRAPGRRRRRPFRWILALLLVLLIAWPAGLMIWANSKIQHTEALSGAPGTAGTTYLLAGSDSRADGAVDDPTEGQRSDTIMLMHVPASGPSALISLPRDTLVDIPGHGENKLNAAFSIGGPPLLVETVEELTAMTVDHYVEIGMGGVQGVVDAVGGVELCLDYDVVDELSGLQWAAGCHEADGETALAFARMRYSDPTGDIGRTERQRQVVSAVVAEVATPATLLNPADHVQLVDAATGALVTDDDTGVIDLARMALAFRNASGPDGIVGTPPIADFDYRPGGIGSSVLLADDAPEFFDRLREGELTPADVEVP